MRAQLVEHLVDDLPVGPHRDPDQVETVVGHGGDGGRLASSRGVENSSRVKMASSTSRCRARSYARRIPGASAAKTITGWRNIGR